MRKYKAWFDGSAKPNPGEMTIGGYIEDDIGKSIFEFSEILGHGTNNQAEYLAFINVIRTAKKLGIKNITIQGDSALVINQVNRKWKAKDSKMLKLKNESLTILEGLNWTLSHVPRNQNKLADLLTR